MTFEVIPSLFLFDGECVHYPPNDHRKLSIYPVDPLTTARQWVAAGATQIEIIDINAAKYGYPSNLGLTCRILRTLDIPARVGGGIRDLSIMETLIQAGASSLALGTAAVSDPHFVEEAVVTYGDRIAIALDTRQGRVAIRGGQELSVRGALDVFQHMFDMGVRTFIYADVSRKSALNIGQIRQLLRQRPGEVRMYAKGATTVEELRALAELGREGLSGVILAQPLYTGQLSLEKARWAVSEAGRHQDYLPPVSDNFA